MKSKKCTVLVLDSGIGGLTTLKSCINLNPNLNYIYFADFKFSPYGNKPIESLRQNLIDNVEMLVKKFKPQIIILACNTATAVGITILRKIYPKITFIGTEPALNLAIKNNHKHILLLATHNTIKYSKLVRKMLLLDKDLKTLSINNLSTKIENNLDSLYTVTQDLKLRFASFGKLDAIVLGCTHYCFLKKYLKSDLFCPIYDGNEGVALQLCNFSKLFVSKFSLKIITNDATKRDLLKRAFEYINKEG